MNQVSNRSARWIPIITTCIFLFVVAGSQAANSLIWSGGAGGNWNNSVNWFNVASPANGDTLIFPAGPGANTTNNIAGLALNQIRFIGAGGGYVVYGNAMTITNGIEATNSTGVNVISNNITFASATDFVVEVATGAKLVLGGTLSGSVGLIKTGGGTNQFAGNVSNNYGGKTTVSNGVVELSKNGAFAASIPNDLIIGDGSVPATVRNIFGFEIPDNANVTVNRFSTWDLNNNIETIAALTITAGSVATGGGGTLTLGGDLTTIASATTATISGNLSLGGANRTFTVGLGTATPDLLISANISDGSASAGINKNGAGRLTLSGNNTYTGPTALSGFVTLASDTALGANGSATNGTTAGPNTILVVQGVNIGNEFLTLSNVSEYRSGGTAGWAGPVTLATDVAIGVFGGTFTISGAITGPGGVTKGQGGTLVYAGSSANNYAGNTTVNVGVLQLAKSGATAIFNGTLTIGDNLGGADVDVVREMGPDQIDASVPITINSSGLLDLNGFDDILGPITFSGGHLTTGTGLATLAGNVTANANTNNLAQIDGKISLSATRTFNVVDGIWSPDLEVNAAVSGFGGIIKTNLGEMSLTASNNYTGLTTVGGGFLDVENSFALGSTSAGTVVSNGAALLLDFGVKVGLEPLTLNGPGAFGLFGALNSSFGSNSWAGNIILASDSTVGAFSSGDTLNLSGQISGAGALTKIGAGALMLSGSVANNYAGSTFLNQGTALLNKGVFDGAIPNDLTIGDGVNPVIVSNLVINQISNGSHVTINFGSQLNLNGNLDGIASLDMTGSSVQTGAGFLELLSVSGAITTHASSSQSFISGTLDLGGPVRTFDVAFSAVSPALVVSANILDGGILKNGAGNMLLSGANTYDGLTIVSNAFILVGSATALGTTNGGTALSGGNLVVQGVSVVNEALTNNVSSDQFQSTGPAGWSGKIVLNATLGVLPFNGTNNLSGVISGVGGITKGQAGMLLYSGSAANTYTGATTVNQGTLQLNKGGSDGSIQGDLVIGDGVGGANADVVRDVGTPQIATVCNITIASSGLLDLNEVSDGIGTLSGSGEVDTGSTGTGRLLVNGNGSTTYYGVITGAGELFKQGSGTGTFTLSGNNTYTGATSVSSGTLLVDGSQPQSPVTVIAFATLGGSGTVGTIAVSGNLAPGDSPGILTSSNVVFSSSGSYAVELTGPNAGTGYDQLNVRGTNTLASAALHVTAAFTTPVAAGQKFTIINNDGAEANNGIFSLLPEGAGITSSNYQFTISYVGGTGNDVVLTLTNVPGAAVSSTVNAGNGSHGIDPNGCNNFTLVISNTTGLAMTGIIAVLSTTNQGVFITQPYATYPNISAGGRGTNIAPFQISTLPGFVCGTPIGLQLSIDSSLGSFTMNYVQSSGEAAAAPSSNSITGNVAIPDPGAVDSTNVVSGFTGPLAKVVVSLFITHSADSNLTNISLISPDGTAVLLSSANGGAGANYGAALTPESSRTTFDDAAGTAITSGTAPFMGAFRPQLPLSAFNGNSTPNGNWHLHIADGVVGNAGTLRGWTLYLYGTTCATGSGACDACLASIVGAIAPGDFVQTNRWFRDSVTSSCGSPKAWGGFGDFGTNYHYDAYFFTNTSLSEACVSVQLQSASNVMAALYWTSYDASNITNNFAGDSGFDTGQTGGTTTFSASVAAGAKFVVVVNERDASTNTQPYTLQLSGLPCPPPTLNIQPVAPNQARIYWDTSAGGYLLESVSNLNAVAWGSVTNEPVVSGGNYNVTNSTALPATNRFYRLHQP